TFAPAEALRQILSLGEGLVALHHQGIAHLHVHPDSLFWVQGRFVLGGLEAAQVLPQGSPDAPFFFARDANFLALTLGPLTSGGSGALATGQGPANQQLEAAISAIREKGADQAYRSAEQVLAECQQALAQVSAAAATGPIGQPTTFSWSIDAGH